MNARTDYDQLAGKIDLAKLDRKLDQLREQEPPKRRKGVAGLLDPMRDKLLELHAKGWTYQKLAQELHDGGLPVKVATLRNYLTGRAHKAKKSTRRAGRKGAQT
jgi:hypothetical protein